MQSFGSDDADVLWKDLRARFLGGGETAWIEGRTGRTREIRAALLKLARPQQRWVVRRTPINPAGVLAEVIWILLGRQDAPFVNFWNPSLPRFAGDDDTYYGAYGFRLRVTHGLDQLKAAADALRNNPGSRQVCLSIWDPVQDMPGTCGTPRSADIPCNVFSMLKVRDGRLHWTQIMRSNDFWLGLPVNLVQFTCLQEIVAGWIGCDVGEYCHLSDSLHVYERDWIRLKTLPVAPPACENTDDLRLEYEASTRIIAEIGRKMDLVRAQAPGLRDARRLYPPEDWPEGYANMLRVILADAVRRHGDWDGASDIMKACTNPLLTLLWGRWCDRQKQG